MDLYRLIRKQVLDDFGDFGLAGACGSSSGQVLRVQIAPVRVTREQRHVQVCLGFSLVHHPHTQTEGSVSLRAHCLEPGPCRTLYVGTVIPPPSNSLGKLVLRLPPRRGDAEVAALRLLSRSPRISTSGGPASSSQARNPTPAVDGGFLPAPIHRPIHRAPPGGDV